ncbi:MAG TPA: hypothetical protein VKZ53_25990 [Candidatus Angelobacter sp.]|nr:hypothetical protein [Candidatus Angelobacter sp.]
MDHRKKIKVTTIQCSNCGQAAHVVRGNYRFSESGLNNVMLCGIEIIRCDHCGNEDPMIPAMNELFRTIARALVSKPYRLAGEEVRFLRKYLSLTGDKFSRLLHVDKTTLSKWENNEDPVGTQSDLAIRLLVMSQDPGLKNNITEIVNESFEKIQFRQQISKGKKHKYIPQRPTIEINTSDLSYAYA